MFSRKHADPPKPQPYQPAPVSIGGLAALITHVSAPPGAPVDIQVNGTVYALTGAATTVYQGRVRLLLSGRPYPEQEEAAGEPPRR